jgi:ABC-type branched-subunit amino acid transport system substrate-binding protein
MKNWYRRLLLPVSFCILHFTFCISSIAQPHTLSKKDTSDIQYLDGKKYYILKVEKSETLYGISKRFNVTQDELIKINPWLKDGLKAKFKLWIPAPASTTKSTGKEESGKEKIISKQIYKVALFLPLSLSNVNYDYVPVDSVQVNIIDKETLAALEFYEGVEHAIDSLARKDSKIHLSVFDTRNDTLITSLLLKDNRMKEMDFIISQNNNVLLKQINRFSMERNIPMFTFSQNATETIKANPNAYALQPSSNLQCKEGGKFAGNRFPNANALAIKTSASKEGQRAIAFQSGWTSVILDSKVRILDYTSLDSNVVLKALVKGKNNVLFVASSNEDIVNPLLSGLIGYKDEYEFTIIGLPTWQYFESIDMEILEDLNTYIFSAARIAPDQPGTESFRNYFRNKYMIEPTDAAMQGYDLMMLIGKNFMGKNASEMKSFSGIFTNYTFPESKNVHENNFINMLRYKGYELVEVK